MGVTSQLKRIAVVGGVLLGSVFVYTGEANAFPSGCVITYNGLSQGHVFCSGGTGTYRAIVDCDNFPWFDYTSYGPWRSPGSTSAAICDSGDPAYNLRAEIFGPI